MKTVPGILLTGLLILAAGALHGEPAGTPVERTQTQPQARAPLYDKDRPWRQWRLTRADWITYEALMQGPAGAWYADAAPIQVLATQPELPEADLARYAALWAALQSRRELAETRWQIAYNAARDKLDPTTRAAWDAIRLRRPASLQDAAVAVGVFDVACRAACAGAVGTLTARGAGTTHLYLAGANGDNAIRQWAGEHGIPIEAVRAQRITLNHAGAILAALGHPGVELPALFVREPGGYRHVE